MSEVTVILPVYNEKKKYLESAISSILNQTYSDFEFLIINDGSVSTQCTQTLIDYANRDKRIKFIHNKKNLGLTATLNNGIKLARGEYIARADSDDIYDNLRLEKQLNFMKKNPDYVLCGTYFYLIDEHGIKIDREGCYYKYSDIEKHIIEKNYFAHSSWFFKKNIISDLGGYYETAKYTEDYDLLLRIIQKYPVAILPEYLCSHRVNSNSMSFTHERTQEKYAIIARLNAIKKYHYSKKNYCKLILPILKYLFVPYFIRHYILRLKWKI